jgi:hypothetical protein
MTDHVPILGTTGSNVVSINVQKLLVTKMLLTASSGGGKSWAIRRLLEQTFGFAQHIVFDPDGEFHTLREKLPYALIGEGGEAAARVDTAGMLATRLLQLGSSAIIDLSDLKSQKDAYVAAFVGSMMNAPRDLWHGVLVVIDECHKFAPEKGAGEAASTEAIKDLSTDGRKRGFCLVAATQRVAELHKTVVAECQNRLVGLTTMDLDIDRARRVVGMKSAHADEVLKGLDTGQFFAVGPALSREVVCVKIGAVVTTHPEAGAAALPPTPTPEKIRKVLGSLKDLPKAAAEEAHTVEQLRKRVRELEAQVASAPAAPEPVRVEVPVVDPALIAAMLEAAKEVAAAREGLAAEIARIEQYAAQFTGPPVGKVPIGKVPSGEQLLKANLIEAGRKRRALRHDGPLLDAEPPKKVTVITGKHQITVPADSKAAAQLPRAKLDSQDILDAIALIESLGISISFKLLAAWLGVHPNSKGFLGLLGKLRGEGMLDELQLTGEGRAIARTPTITTDDTRRQILRSKRTDQELRILDTIAALGGETTHKKLAAWMGMHPNSKGLLDGLAKLRSVGYLNEHRLTNIGELAASARKMTDADVIAKLDDMQRRIVSAVRGAGEVPTHKQLAGMLDMHPNTRSLLEGLGSLRTRGLLTNGWPVKPTDVFAGVSQ